MTNKSRSVVVPYENLVIWHLEHGADPNIPSYRGYTPLDSAPLTSSLNTVKALISHGADLQKTRALITAAESYNVNPAPVEIMALLLDHGVDIDRVEIMYDPFDATVFAGTALHRAVEKQDAERVRFLLWRGANRHVKGFKGLMALEAAEARGLRDMVDILRK